MERINHSHLVASEKRVGESSGPIRTTTLLALVGELADKGMSEEKIALFIEEGIRRGRIRPLGLVPESEE